MKPPRTPWTDFPDVLIHASESAVKQHPVYRDAKAGDDVAAGLLVSTTIDPGQVEKLALLLRGKHGTELENWWRKRFAHAFDALTESEARYLVRSPEADAIRDRIAAAEQAGDRP
jgi:hypothetical protein